jgi:hypothetical protein
MLTVDTAGLTGTNVMRDIAQISNHHNHRLKQLSSSIACGGYSTSILADENLPV